MTKARGMTQIAKDASVSRKSLEKSIDVRC
ncbi:hypothetical protein [Paenalcaligenes faecalis]